MTSNDVSTPFGKARTVSTNVFISELLPPLDSSIEINTFIDENLHQLPVTKNGCLWGYNTKNPSQVRGRKLSAFKSLALCARKIAKLVSQLAPTSVFRNNDASVWDLDKRNDASMPDAYLIDETTSVNCDGIDWWSVVVPGVYSKVFRQCECDNVSFTIEFVERMSHTVD